MKNLTAEDLERKFTIKQMESYIRELKNKCNSLSLQNTTIIKKQESIIKKEVELRTKDLTDEIKNKEKVIEEKDKEIEALKEKIIKMQLKMDTDSTNSGIPTSKTPIGKKKRIPNTREKTNKKIGGQKGHPKHKLKPFSDDEITETVTITPKICDKCLSKNIEVLETSVDKQELDYEVKVIKRKNKFMNCRCKNCGHEFHANIPKDLKEDIQYGKTVQSLAVCLTNEIYTPFNKTVKLIKGITNEEINMSEGYVTKLQKRASKGLEEFIKEIKEYIPKQAVYGWDDGVVTINTKNGILRTYCTDEVVLLIGHENKKKEGLDEDGILKNTPSSTIVMHDHFTHNYNQEYNFENVECVIHLIRRLKKMKEATEHKWCDKLISLLSKTNKDRNELIRQNIDKFEIKYLKELEKEYDDIIKEAQEENNEERNYFKKEEKSFINDLIKYKKNYLLWAYKFYIPSTNNNSERNIRPVKSKLKISGQFKNINYVKYYADIRSYIETCKKNGINIIEACVRLMNGNPYTLNEILKLQKNSE